MKKRAYSELMMPRSMRAYVKKLVQKQIDRNWDCNQLMEYLVNMIEKNHVTLDNWHKKIEAWCFSILALVMRGQAIHWFFQESDSHEWLLNASKGLDTQILTDFYNSRPKHIVPIILHFKGGTSPCYLFTPLSPAEGDLPFCFVFSEGISGIMPPSTQLFEEQSDYEKKNNIAIRVISSAIAYKMCFPDAFVDGIPEDLKHPNHYRRSKGESQAISIPHVSEDAKHAVSPHYRSGCFCTLRHKRFKANIGKVIFRKGCFVHGHAETIVE